MRRADRLFELLHLFRGGRLHTGQTIADRLGVSVRTIYRDINSLIASGVPIDGERGVGYLLREPIFLPPLTLSIREIEALHLGMAMVSRMADPELAMAASDVLKKVEAVLPSDRPRVGHDWGVAVYTDISNPLAREMLAKVIAAVRKREILSIIYRTVDGTTTDRMIRPLQVEYWGNIWTCTAWCELRSGFRVFRVDRINKCKSTGRRYDAEIGRQLSDYAAAIAACTTKQGSAT
jgi:predicted DNA-binding transcriptional regulator YafY